MERERSGGKQSVRRRGEKGVGGNTWMKHGKWEEGRESEIERKKENEQ